MRMQVMEKWAAMLLLSYPTLMLTVRGGMNGVFILALLSSLLVWIFSRDRYARAIGGRELRLFSFSMLGLLVATLISQSYWQDYSAHQYDAISRYWLAIPVLLWFSSMPPRVFSTLQFAFPLAAISGFFLSDALTVLGRATTTTLDPIHFGDTALLFGLMSLYSMDWLERDKPGVRLFKLAGFLAGLVASFASGSRGGWLAIPVIAILSLHFFRKHLSWKTLVLVLIATAAMGAVIYSQSGMVRQRIIDLESDIQTAQAGRVPSDLDTSLGVRVQLYRAAAAVFIHHPIVGVGPGGFAKEMAPMQEAGVITPLAAELGRGEVHNDILAKAAAMGAIGLGAILALYAVPLMLFWSATKSQLREVRRAGILGVVFVSSIVTFGLTVEFLNLTLAAALYAFTVAVLLAACHSFQQSNKYNKQQEKNEQAS